MGNAGILIELRAGEAAVVIDGDLLSVLIEDPQDGIHGRAETLGPHFKDQLLLFLHVESEAFRLPVTGRARDGYRDLDVFAAVVPGRGVDQELSGVGCAAGANNGQQAPPLSRGVRRMNLHTCGRAAHLKHLARKSGRVEPKLPGSGETGAEQCALDGRAGLDADRRDGFQMRRSADIELIGEVRIQSNVCRLDDGVIFAGLVESVRDERIPDEGVFAVRELAAVQVQQDERRVEAIPVAGRAQVEDPGLAFPRNAEAEEVEIAVDVELAVDRRGYRNLLRFIATAVRLDFENVRLIADAE